MEMDGDIKQAIQLRQIGAKIAYYRTLRGLHQNELAKMVGLSKSVLSRMERGRYNSSMSVPSLLKIADALHIEVSQFLTFNEDEKKMWWEDLSRGQISGYDSDAPEDKDKDEAE